MAYGFLRLEAGTHTHHQACLHPPAASSIDTEEEASGGGLWGYELGTNYTPMHFWLPLLLCTRCSLQSSCLAMSFLDTGGLGAVATVCLVIMVLLHDHVPGAKLFNQQMTTGTVTTASQVQSLSFYTTESALFNLAHAV